MRQRKIIYTICIIIITIILAKAFTVFAANPPSLQDPANDTVTSDPSPKLSWQYSDSCPGSESCFLVEVDNNDDFSSPEKSNYTNSLNYSPSLSNGKWFWHVKAKDTAGSWSDYSESRSFTIDITQTPADPSPAPTNTPSGTSSPTATPDPTSVPTSAPAGSAFQVSNTPANIDSNKSFTVAVQINHLQANSKYYLKGAFYKEGSTNYFGQTKVSGSWIKNSASAPSQFNITTDGSGNWAGNLEVMPDSEDSGYSGSGNYQFKVGRYNSAGSDLTWSPSSPIYITDIPDTDSDTDPTPSPSSAKTITTAAKTTTTSSLVKTGSGSILSNDFFPDTATIAGIEANSPEDTTPVNEGLIVKEDKSFNWWLLGAGVAVLLASSYPLIKLFKIKLPFDFVNLEKFPFFQRSTNGFRMLLKSIPAEAGLRKVKKIQS